MTKSKIAFYTAWLVLMSLAPITILLNTPLSEAFKYPATTANVFQRLVGLWAFTMLFVQVVLGSFMSKLADKLGGWIYTFHVVEGITVYTLILAHPILFMAFNYFAGKGIDPFYVFTQACLICKNKVEIYYTLGRVSFWFLTIAVGAGFFRTASPFLRKYWKKFHILNYFSFLIIGLHSLFVGTDIGTFPFSFFHGPALIIGLGITLYKFVWPYFKKTEEKSPKA